MAQRARGRGARSLLAMMSHASPTLRQLLVRLVVITQVPALLAAGALMAVHLKTQRGLQLESMRSSSLALAGSIGQRLEGVQRDLDRLAVHVPAGGAGLDAFHAEAAGVAAAAKVDTIVLVKPTGEQILNTRVPYGTGLPLHTPETMMQAVRTGRPSVSELVKAPFTGRHVVGIGVPVIRSEDIVYGLNAGLEPQRFDELFAGLKLPSGWIAAIADSRGVIVAVHPPQPAAAGTELPAALARELQARDSGLIESAAAGGDTFLTAYQRTSASGWMSIVTVPSSVLYAPAWKSGAEVAIGVLLLLWAGFWAATWLGHRITESMDVLRRAAHALPAGAPEPLPRRAFREAQELQRALAEAGESIHHANGQLRKSERRLSAVLRTAGNAIIVTDLEGSIVGFNRAAERIFGRTTGNVAGRSIRELFTREGWDDWRRAAAQALGRAGAPGEPTASHCVRADGTLFPVELLMSTFDEGEGGTFYTLILRDTTEMVRAHESLLAAHEEVERLHRRFHRSLMRQVDVRQGEIARELHDAVGSSLAGISLLLGGGRALANDARLAALLQKAQEQVAGAAERLRRISRGLMPAGSDAGALLPALEQFAQDIGELQGVTCTVRWRGEFTDVSPTVGGHLFRIVQEATANALRHGRAKHLRLRLAQAERACSLTISDDGAGCDFRVLPRSHPGIGLQSMEARAGAIDGKLEIRCAGSGGCTVRVCWPR